MIIYNDYEPNQDPLSNNTALTLGVFFDGTLNNRENVRSRKPYQGQDVPELAGESQAQLAARKAAAKEHSHHFALGDETSYNNDESNVARLEQYYFADDTEDYKVYIEGIGTEDLKSDNATAAGLGNYIFAAGVRTRVMQACREIADLAKKANSESNNSDGSLSLTFNVYGFSRGATSARQFVSEISFAGMDRHAYVSPPIAEVQMPPHGRLGELLEERGLTIDKLTINFIGLFDTVSSYGIVHSNDTRQLKLNKLYQAQKVVQLSAQNEHRKNFALIDITSAGNRGLTIALPGSHADIGGGYAELIKQEDVKLWEPDTGGKLEAALGEFIIDPNYKFYTNDSEWARKDKTKTETWRAFLEAGWYRPQDIENNSLGLFGKRKGLTNKYAAIPLMIMAEQSEKHKAKIDLAKLKKKFKPEGITLDEAHARIMEEINRGIAQGNNYIKPLEFDDELNAEEIKALATGQKMEPLSWGEKMLLISPLSETTIRRKADRTVKSVVEEASKIAHTGSGDAKYAKNHLIKRLRNQYLHVSANEANSAIILEPHETNPGGKREIRQG